MTDYKHQRSYVKTTKGLEERSKEVRRKIERKRGWGGGGGGGGGERETERDRDRDRDRETKSRAANPQSDLTVASSQTER